MIFEPPARSVDDDGTLRVWGLEELKEQVQVYARHYDVEFGGPVIRWVCMESTSVYSRLLKIERDAQSHNQWDEMFERWKDARVLELHAMYIQDASDTVSSDNLCSHEIDEGFVAIRRPKDMRSN